MSAEIRLFTVEDSVEDLTDLLHRAYADHAAEGRSFFASYQTPQDTRNRIAKGECWLAEREGVVVGMVVVEGAGWFPDGYPGAPAAGTFSQLAVPLRTLNFSVRAMSSVLAMKTGMCLGLAPQERGHGFVSLLPNRETALGTPSDGLGY